MNVRLINKIVEDVKKLKKWEVEYFTKYLTSEIIPAMREQEEKKETAKLMAGKITEDATIYNGKWNEGHTLGSFEVHIPNRYGHSVSPVNSGPCDESTAS